MRKVFFFIALLFSVVCYAAPPPDQPTSFLIENLEAVFRSQNFIADYSFEVQEVAFVYIGDCFYSKPAYINKLYGWEPNKQNTNYEYPFGADF